MITPTQRSITNISILATIFFQLRQGFGFATVKITPLNKVSTKTPFRLKMEFVNAL